MGVEVWPVGTTTGDRLAEAMERRGLDQSELARRLGVAQGSISKIIVGRTSNSRLIPRLAVELGVSTRWLLCETDDPEGDGSDAELSADEAKLLRIYRELGKADRAALRRLIEHMRPPEDKD
jgi:transcriptional regulator with XRE-family HTH domain